MTQAYLSNADKEKNIIEGRKYFFKETESNCKVRASSVICPRDLIKRKFCSPSGLTVKKMTFNVKLARYKYIEAEVGVVADDLMLSTYKKFENEYKLLLYDLCKMKVELGEEGYDYEKGYRIK